MHFVTAAQGAQLLARGELLAFPTETVYGLGADATQADAVGKIFAAKGRPTDHPLIVHIANPSAVQRFATQVSPAAERLMAEFWPGPLTLIVPRKNGVAAAAAGGQTSIGLRCPSHPTALTLLRAAAQLGVHGVAAPSANRFGQLSPTLAQHVVAGLAAAVPNLSVIDGGPCSVGVESTLVDCTVPEGQMPRVLRPGSISAEDIAACLAAPLFGQHRDRYLQLSAATQPTAHAHPSPKASGTLDAHYAPRTPLKLLSADDLAQKLRLLDRADSSAPVDRDSLKTLAVFAPQSTLGVVQDTMRRASQTCLIVKTAAMPPSPEAAAQDLFATLHALDAARVDQIWVELPPQTAAWAAINDRLRRAAASF